MQSLNENRVVVIAGNGPSVRDIAPGQVLRDDFIIRLNNFFFEPQTWLGDRVDLFVVGGDPRVAPFLLETLKSCLGGYRIAGWSSFNPRVVKAGRKRLPLQYFDMPVFSNADFARQAEDILKHYRVKPMTGTYAVLMAYAAGARKFVLTGMDFYSEAQRYMYKPGPHQKALMGQDIARRGMDEHLHDPRLDLELIRLLSRQDGVEIQHANCSGHLAMYVDIAPVREGERPDVRSRNAPTDWTSKSGYYPIRLLRALRFVRSWQRRLMAKDKRNF